MPILLQLYFNWSRSHLLPQLNNPIKHKYWPTTMFWRVLPGLAGQTRLMWLAGLAAPANLPGMENWQDGRFDWFGSFPDSIKTSNFNFNYKISQSLQNRSFWPWIGRNWWCWSNLELTAYQCGVILAFLAGRMLVCQTWPLYQPGVFSQRIRLCSFSSPFPLCHSTLRFWVSNHSPVESVKFLSTL